MLQTSTEPIRNQTDPRNNERILILAPTGRDAQLAAAALHDGGIVAAPCRSIEELCAQARAGCGGAMVTEESLTPYAMSSLHDVLVRQPPWSDLPLIIFTSQPFGEFKARSFDALGRRANITYLERPIRVKTMVSAAEAALRARRRQYEVRDLVDELHSRIQERDQFLAMLGHELRNPLAAITLAIDSLRGDGDSTHDILKRQTKHLKKLVDDLLDIGRITSGKIILHRSETNLGEIVANCVESMRARAAAHRLTLRFERSEAFVDGDPDRLEQVVSNLLSNAIKYTPAGGIVEIFIGRDDGEAVLRVRDTGKGIAPEMLTRIFELFTQADVTLDRAEGGMGIGLTLVRKLVELHDGTVEARSAGRGKGSEFTVRIPAITPMQRPASREQTTIEHDDAATRRILVVEDNTDIRMLLRAELKRLGHHVDVAGDGTEGLQKILETKPQVALIDIGLPGLDGYEIARRVRGELGDSIYLIALSGYGQAEDRQRAQDAGFDVHLTKPAGIMELERVLAKA